MQAPRRKKQLVRKSITVPGNFRLGCDEFNSGLFFECHERFESGSWRLRRARPLQGVDPNNHRLRPPSARQVHRRRTAPAHRVGVPRALPAGRRHGLRCRGDPLAAEDVYRRVVAAGPDGVASVDISRRPYYKFDLAKLPAEARRWKSCGFDDYGRALEMTITVAE